MSKSKMSKRARLEAKLGQPVKPSKARQGTLKAAVQKALSCRLGFTVEKSINISFPCNLHQNRTQF